MSAVPLPPPGKVSPLIKLVRYTLFISGIYYGVHKLNYYRSYDIPMSILREKQHKEDIARNIENNKQNLSDLLILLAGLVGIKYEPGWRPDFLK